MAHGRTAARGRARRRGADLRRRRLDRPLRGGDRRSPSAPSASTSRAAAPFERELAAELGAKLLDEDFPKRLGPYPITVDASARQPGLACALRSTEADGICTSIGIYFAEETPVPLLEMYTKGIRFETGRVHARPAIEPILELVRSGAFRPELVTRETASWDEAAEAVAGHGGKLVISRR